MGKIEKRHASALESSGLRLYTFVNFYLSSIQQGIQTAHVVSELSRTYRGSRSEAAKMLHAWEDYGKTIIVLNGGTARDVGGGGVRTGYLGYRHFQRSDWSKMRYPFAHFDEEPGALHPTTGGATTAWGIILPAEVYEAKPVEVFPSRHGFSTIPAEIIDAATPIWEPGSPEHAICSYLQGKSLAR